MDKLPNNERRKQDRRSAENKGPPPGCGERRINIERRLFNIEVYSLYNWLQASESGD